MNKSESYWSNKQFLYSVIAGVLLLIISLIINYFSMTFASLSISNPVKDILLDNLPVIDVTFLFNQGAILFILFVLILSIYDSKKMPFMLKSVALFVVVRSFFIIMTHLAPFPDRVLINPNDLIAYFTSGNDLFFSGHTGLPFLFALAYWDNKSLRFAFMIMSLLAAVSVLLGHLHYSIDVFAAFFITYGIFNIAKKLFAKDYKLFLHGMGDSGDIK